jgi:hypothetical protein
MLALSQAVQLCDKIRSVLENDDILLRNHAAEPFGDYLVLLHGHQFSARNQVA